MLSNRYGLVAVTTGPAFGQLRTLSEQLEASVLLVRPTVTEGQLDRVHGELEALLFGIKPTKDKR